MLTFQGYGQVVTMQVGEGTGLGLKTPGDYSSTVLLYFRDNISRPAVGINVFVQGEIVSSKRGNTLLKIQSWNTFDGKIRSKFTRKESAQTNPATGDSDF